MKKTDILIAGVGGQGVVLVSDIIAGAALAAGYDVKKTDTLGMAQRGGSVISHLRLAEAVKSPLASEGRVDLILALEKLEMARWRHFLRDGGAAVVNDHAQPPLSVSLGQERYPADDVIIASLRRRTERVYLVPGMQAAVGLGNPRVLNIFMLGCASVFLPIEVSCLEQSISASLKPALRDLNLAAFARGREEIASCR